MFHPKDRGDMSYLGPNPTLGDIIDHVEFLGKKFFVRNIVCMTISPVLLHLVKGGERKLNVAALLRQHGRNMFVGRAFDFVMLTELFVISSIDNEFGWVFFLLFEFFIVLISLITFKAKLLTVHLYDFFYDYFDIKLYKSDYVVFLISVFLCLGLNRTRTGNADVITTSSILAFFHLSVLCSDR